MKIKDAMMLWDEETRDVAIAQRGPDKHGRKLWHSTGACWSFWKDMDNNERMILFLVTALKQSTICNIPIGNFKKALMDIDEIKECFIEGGWPVPHEIQS